MVSPARFVLSTNDPTGKRGIPPILICLLRLVAMDEDAFLISLIAPQIF